jgi:tetratricopeptide (TPR) repeat protein
MTEEGSQQVPISEAMRLATEHHQAGRLPEAEAIYRAVLQSAPAHAGARYNLALIALQQGSPKEAIPVMREATEREPNIASHWMNYAVALAGSGQLQAARQALLSARERKLGGNALDGMLDQVERMLRSEAWPTVVETVGEAGEDGLRMPNVPGLLGLYEGGRYEQVVEQARAFWPEFSSSATLARLLGGALLALNRFEEAREVLLLASGPHGEDALIYRMLGMALRRLGRGEEARPAFERSLELAPDSADTLLHAAVNALTLRDPEQARRYGERALELQPYSVDALWVLADAVASGGDRAQAIELYRRAIALDPNVAELRINLGDALTGEGRLAEAVAELQHALTLRPNDAQAHLNLGAALFRLGEIQAAREHYRMASDLAPERTDVQTANLLRT